ncbi:MAG: formylglycine-generating enzyme family protein [Cyanobacteria bacterium P01_D01_bin.50]
MEKFNFDIITVNSRGEKNKTLRGKATQEIENLGNDVKLEMVHIPSGSFVMGAPETEKGSLIPENLQHSVKVPAFFMSKYPITQAQWRRIAILPKIKRNLEPEPSNFKGDDHPVEQISWYDAIEFCDRLSKYTDKQYRLPSEAEWEYGCRAGTNTPFHFGETLLAELANYNASQTYGYHFLEESRSKTTPVGQFSPNAFGLYDMHGNVWEWCLDTWHSNYEGAPADGSAWIGKDDNCRVLRGGSWQNFPQQCRSACRRRCESFNILLNTQGFRVVRSKK